MYLEHLQRQPDEVEGADDAELAPGLLLQGHEGDLNDDERRSAGRRSGRSADSCTFQIRALGRESDEDGDGEGAAGQLQEGELDQAAGEQPPPTQRETSGIGHD